MSFACVSSKLSPVFQKSIALAKYISLSLDLSPSLVSLESGNAIFVCNPPLRLDNNMPTALTDGDASLLDDATSVSHQTPGYSASSVTVPLSQVSTTTRLLERRRQLAAVNHQLQSTQVDLCAKHDNLSARSNAFCARNAQFQEAMTRYHSFLKELDGRRSRADKRSAAEAKSTSAKDIEISDAAATIDDLAASTRLSTKEAHEAQRYSELIREFCATRAEEFPEPAAVPERYAALTQAHDDLMREQSVLDEQLEQARQSLTSLHAAQARHRASSEILLSALRERLRQAKGRTEALQASADDAVCERSARMRELTTVLATLENLHARCRGSRLAAVIRHSVADAVTLEDATADAAQATVTGTSASTNISAQLRISQLSAPVNAASRRRGSLTMELGLEADSPVAAVNSASAADGGRGPTAPLLLAGSALSVPPPHGRTSPSHGRTEGSRPPAAPGVAHPPPRSLLQRASHALQQLHVVGCYVTDSGAMVAQYSLWKEAHDAQERERRATLAAVQSRPRAASQPPPSPSKRVPSRSCPRERRATMDGSHAGTESVASGVRNTGCSAVAEAQSLFTSRARSHHGLTTSSSLAFSSPGSSSSSVLETGLGRAAKGSLFPGRLGPPGPRGSASTAADGAGPIAGADGTTYYVVKGATLSHAARAAVAGGPVADYLHTGS